MAVRVVITDWDLGNLEAAERILAPVGVEVATTICTSDDDVIAAAAEADALMVRFAPVPAQAFEASERLQFISRLGIGPWRVDLAAAAEAKVAVADCPRFCTDEAVEHTLAMILALNRRLEVGLQAARAGHWATYGDDSPIRPLASQTLGVIGVGRVGRRVAAAAYALGMDVIAYDPYALGAPEGTELVDFDTLLLESDIICLLCPITPETHHLVNQDTLSRLRPGTYLVNTARGGLIDEEALLAALDSGQLAGAALDVLEKEPPPPDHPLLHRDDVLLTPHVGFLSNESTHELKVYGARNVVHYFTGERVASLLTPDFRRV